MTLLIHGRASSEQMAEQVAHNTRRTGSFCLFGRHTRFSGNYRTVMSQYYQNEPPVSAFANECVETRTLSKYKLMNAQFYYKDRTSHHLTFNEYHR